MTCRSCGTTIAEKAIVCYKCGTPTEDLAPVTRGPAGAARSSVPWVAVAAVLEVAALAAVYWFGREAGWPVWQQVVAVGAVLAAGTLVTLRVSAGARSGRLRRK
ncbi:MAG: hypothetical protein NUW22_08715 [Acidobacteria bacterium]|nr:hypothetical protein [Acidobacteriota bacterium]